MHPLLRVLAGIAIMFSACIVTGIVRVGVAVLRFGVGDVLGGTAKPLPDEPGWLWAGLIIGAVLAVTLTRGRRK